MDGQRQRYQLSDDVHVALVPDGTAIFLDVRRDRYLGIEAGRVQCLGRLVAGWPGDDEQNTGADVHAAVLDTAAELHEDGLIAHASVNYVAPEIRNLWRAERSLLSHGEGATNINAGLAWRFLRAWLATEVTLKRGSLRLAIGRLRTISLRGIHEPQPSDEARLAELVGSFRRLRAAFYTARLECLYNSTALYRYLVGHGLQPVFVIGVAVRPFRAHCWLQSRDLVYDDDPEFIQQFVPILTV